ncbi:MAG: DUF3261 domain-containing protein [Gammaproteobacteria bacterium]
MSLKPVLLLALLSILGGCSILQASNPAQRLPLSTPEALPCCWQSVERVRALNPDSERDFTVVVASTEGKLTVVVLDILGRRLVTIIHDGGELRTLEAPARWPAALSRQLLVSIYLHHLTPQQRQLESPDWVIRADDTHKSLIYRGREQVRLDYLSDSSSFDRVLTYSGRDIRLHIRTLSRTTL